FADGDAAFFGGKEHNAARLGNGDRRLLVLGKKEPLHPNHVGLVLFDQAIDLALCFEECRCVLATPDCENASGNERELVALAVNQAIPDAPRAGIDTEGDHAWGSGILAYTSCTSSLSSRASRRATSLVLSSSLTSCGNFACQPSVVFSNAHWTLPASAHFPPWSFNIFLT